MRDWIFFNSTKVYRNCLLVETNVSVMRRSYSRNSINSLNEIIWHNYQMKTMIYWNLFRCAASNYSMSFSFSHQFEFGRGKSVASRGKFPLRLVPQAALNRAMAESIVHLTSESVPISGFTSTISSPVKRPDSYTVSTAQMASRSVKPPATEIGNEWEKEEKTTKNRWGKMRTCVASAGRL